MKVLVTGATGHLGSFVVRELAEHGHQLTLFVQSRPDAALGGWPYVVGDLTDFDACRRALDGDFDAVQHLAAQPWPTDHPALRKRAEEKGLPFDTTMRSNLLGLYYLLTATAAAGVKTFIMTGSNCALGHGFRISGKPFPFRFLPVDETHPSAVEDSYSYTKLAGEEMLAMFTRAYGIQTSMLRPCSLCDSTRRRGMAENARPASEWNPFLWAWVGSEDVASAHRLLMEQAGRIEPHGIYYCIADDTSALEPSLELVERFRPELLPLADALPGHASFITSQKLKDTVGWRPRTSWRDQD